MVKAVYSIKDIKGELFADPFFALNTATAMRNFAQIAMDPSTIINQWPDDYVLYHLGSFDPTTGVIERLESPMNLGAASQFLQPELMQEAN